MFLLWHSFCLLFASSSSLKLFSVRVRGHGGEWVGGSGRCSDSSQRHLAQGLCCVAITFFHIRYSLCVRTSSLGGGGGGGRQIYFVPNDYQNVSRSLQDVDYVCISDNYWMGTKKPCITYGLR